MVGQGFDGDVVARVHLELRLQQLAEVAPMHGVGGCWQVVVGRPAGARLRRRRRRQRAARRPGGSRTAACHKRALEEAASLVVEIVEQLLPMLLKLRAIMIVPCAHDWNS
jgi:hypothetical protein